MMSNKITDQELAKVYSAAATIVDQYGPKYLPIFERIHREVEARTVISTMLRIARNAAKAVE